MGTLISQHKCLKCGHIWWPRSAGLPMFCPKCRRKNPLVKPKEKSFNFNLEQGQRVFIDACKIWVKDDRGVLSNAVFNKEYHYARRRNKLLRRCGGDGGVWVWCEKESPDL